MMRNLIINEKPHPCPLSKEEGSPGCLPFNSVRRSRSKKSSLRDCMSAFAKGEASAWRACRGMTTRVFILMIFFTQTASAQTIPILTFDSFKKYLQPSSDSVYVINFWATWCKPCVEELPAFEKLNETYKNQKVKVLLVSLDFKSQYDKKVVPFVKKNKLNSEVIMLDTQGDNSFIDKVSPQWQGTIPATAFVHIGTSTKNFFEKQFSYEQLENIVKPLIKMQP